MIEYQTEPEAVREFHRTSAIQLVIILLITIALW